MGTIFREQCNIAFGRQVQGVYAGRNLAGFLTRLLIRPCSPLAIEGLAEEGTGGHLLFPFTKFGKRATGFHRFTIV
jgi:hypothetical protein